MKLALISPRLEKHTVGGAERLILSLAKILKHSGHHVKILTTSAKSHESWQNEIPEGLYEIDNIPIQRFNIDGRNLQQYAEIDNLIQKRQLSDEEENKWLNNSVHSSSMYQYIEQHKNDYDFFIFAPYLWGLTIKGSSICPQKSLLIPCFHNEPYAKLNIIKNMAENAKGILFNDIEEKALAHSLYNIEDKPNEIVGMPVKTPQGSEKNFRNKYNIQGPFMLYAGRLESGKNINLMTEYFLTYLSRTHKNIKLCFIGKGVASCPIGKHGSLINLGFVPEADKYDAYKAATILCQPSLNESFSIVLLEAFLNKTPALVHSNCPVTKGHIERSKAGFDFKDYADFETMLNWMMDHPEECKELGKNGKQYVENNYSNEAVLKHLENFLINL